MWGKHMNLRYALGLLILFGTGPCVSLSADEAETQQKLQRILIETNQGAFLPGQRPTLPNPTQFDLQGSPEFSTQDPNIINLPPLIPIDNPSVQLTRGSQVLEINRDALYRSGLFDAALSASPELMGAMQAMQSAELRRNRLVFERQKALAANDAELAGAIENEAQKAHNQFLALSDNFALALQRIGVNGAQVAEVATDESQGPKQHVLVEAISNEPGNDFGYATRRVMPNGELGITTVPSEYLLPTPVDANDVFFHNAYATQRLQDGVMLNVTDEAKKNPIARITGMPRFGVSFDTGRQTGNGNFARNVSLLGSNDPASGQTSFLQTGGRAETPFDLLLDTQILDVGGHTLQFYVDANNDQNVEQLETEHLGFRAYNRQRGSLFEGWMLVIGQSHSLFSQVALRPDSIHSSSTLIGTGDRTNTNLPQLAVHIPVVDDVKWRIAIEDPYNGDLFQATGSNLQNTLTRWPTVATNIGWTDTVCHHALQFAGIARNLGFQDTIGAEHFGTAWGLSATGKIGRSSGGGFFFGVSGGDGVGDYVQGVRYSGIAGPGALNTLQGVGTFCGFQEVTRDWSGKTISEFNAAYGYSWMETPALLSSTTDQKFQQAWVNYLRFFSDYMALGFEYQYGRREVASGDQGENHRFLMLLALRTAPPKQSTFVSASPSPLSQEYRIGGRPVTDVVDQSQFGGPAYAQQF